MLVFLPNVSLRLSARLIGIRLRQNKGGKSRIYYRLETPCTITRESYLGSNTALIMPLCPGREVIFALPIFVFMIAPLFMMFRRT